MNEIQQLLASCQAHLADIDGNLSRVAALLGDAPKVESPVRYFHEAETIWRVDKGGSVICTNQHTIDWFAAQSGLANLIECNVPEITAEQAEAILKGGGL